MIKALLTPADYSASNCRVLRELRQPNFVSEQTLFRRRLCDLRERALARVSGSD